MIQEIVCTASRRLDRYLSGRLGVSRERARKMILSGEVLVNNRPARPHTALAHGDLLTVRDAAFSRPDCDMPDPEQGTLHILADDPSFIVVNKPAGILTHPAAGHPGGSLVNLVLSRTPLSPIGAPIRPGVVHRLDRGTSGAIVFAKTEASHRNLANQFCNRTVEKIYWALLSGVLPHLQGEIECAIQPSRENPTKMSVRFFRGRPALTRYRVLARGNDISLVEVRPITGRTHQIRVAFQFLDFPVIGDPVYGRPCATIGRPALHARVLGFDHPETGLRLRFTAPLPSDFIMAAGTLLNGVPL